MGHIMKTYIILNDMDDKATFTVEAESPEISAHKALEELGWWVSAKEEVLEEDHNEAMMSQDDD